MKLHKIKYALARPIFQVLANMHWYRKGYNVTLRFLCEYAGLSVEQLNQEVKALLDKKVVTLSKAGGGYILKNSLVFKVLECTEADLLEPFRYGALAVVTDKQIPGYPCIVVDNPMFLYAKMALYFRSLRSAPVTAVVGSIGKTTTKLMLGSAYSSTFKTLCENGNFTNITHVLQLCQHLNPAYRQLIMEISEANYGTIEAASIALAPKVAVITGIDISHMEEYGDLEEIKRQVCSIVKFMQNDGVVVVNKDEFSSYEYLLGKKVLTISGKGDADYVSKNITIDEHGISFELLDNVKREEHVIRLNNVWGIHNVGMAMQAFAAATFLGMSAEKVIKGLAKYTPQGVRQNAYWTLNGNLVYADCYNAVAKSIGSALRAANSIPVKGRRIAVIADIEETGIMSDKAHYEIVDFVNNSGFDIFIAYGPKLNKALENYDKPLNINVVKCRTSSSVINSLMENKKKGDLILFKASHSWHLDKCIRKLWPISYYWKFLKEKIPYLLWRIGIELY